MTSEIMSVTIVACVEAARPPPFSKERCFLTAFSSWMVAPPRRSSRVIRCVSARVTPGTGAGNRLDAPPDNSTNSRSQGVKSWTNVRSRLAAKSPAWSGIGWAASTIVIRSVGTLWPVLTTMNPPSSRDPRTCSSAWAIRAEALPAPTANTRLKRERS